MQPHIDLHEIEIGPLHLAGVLGVPPQALGMVLFAHGSGSGRLSARNGRVAEALRDAGLATLLMDLLMPREEEQRAKVFDIELLTTRLRLATQWVRDDARVAHLPIGYFGASTGASAALKAAAALNGLIRAVVSRGGRPDLAGDALLDVSAPTLLIVGGIDYPVISLNHAAYGQLSCEKELVIVPGAGHLFEEAGTLEQVVGHASRWFTQHLPASTP